MQKTRKRNWLERFLMRRMDPIPEARARKWQNRLAMVYLIVTWNMAAILLYRSYAKYFAKINDDNQPPGYMADFTIQRINLSGFTMKDTTNTNKEDENIVDTVNQETY